MIISGWKMGTVIPNTVVVSYEVNIKVSPWWVVVLDGYGSAWGTVVSLAVSIDRPSNATCK